MSGEPHPPVEIYAPAPAPRAGYWPWAPGTIAQGFLSGRWNRRDGVGYPSATAQTRETNSPIRGGDDVNAKVSTASGLPRAT